MRRASTSSPTWASSSRSRRWTGRLTGSRVRQNAGGGARPAFWRTRLRPSPEDHAMTEPVVRCLELHKYFRRGSEQIDVLEDLSLDVRRGEFLALMGPSGSGKTTLLNLIAGLDLPSEGEIWVGDNRISAMNESQLAKWRTRH